MILPTTLKTAAILLAIASTSIQPQEFSAAKKNAEQRGTTLVVLVGADWCPACVQMKNGTMQKAARDGALQRAEYAYVDFDKCPELARKLMRGGTIPQLMKFDYRNEKWSIQRFDGAGSDVEQVSDFIRQHQD